MAVINAMAHVVVNEGLVDEAFVRERCDMDAFTRVGCVHCRAERNSPEAIEAIQRGFRSA